MCHIGRLEQAVLKAVADVGSWCGKRCAGALASFFGGWRQTRALTVAGLCLLGAIGARGQGATSLFLWWNPSATAVSYNLYYGTASGTYTNEQSVGSVTNATVSGLLPGTTYYFAATAVDAAGQESVFSSEFIYSVPGIAPAISSIPDQVLDANSTTGPLPFTVSDALVPASSLVVSATSSNPALVPVSNILLGGSGTNRTVTVTPALGQVGSTLISLTVSDGAVSTNASFVLTMTPPPGITLTSPLDGSGFVAPASITLAASVISNGHAISGVQFYNGATLLGQAAAPPYNLAWTGVSAGNYSLSASVTDELGSTVASTPVLVSVSVPVVSSPPAVTLTSPADGGTYLAPAILNLAADVIPNGHTISGVQFYNGATLLGTAGQPPYSLTWTDAVPGACTLSAQATYDNSLIADSSAVTIEVTVLSVSSIPDQVLDENSTTGPLPFTVSDALVPASNLVVSATSSNLALVPVSNILLGGSGTNRTVTVTPALGQVGSTLITLSVSDGAVSTNASFVLTMTPPPGITLTSPLDGSGFVAPASITLAASVISNGHAISGVQFYDGATLLGEVAAPPYNLAWTGVSAGNYSLSASVTDELGSTVASTPVLVSVSVPVVSSPPAVTLTSPSDGGTYLAPAILNLAADVIPNGHTISGVQFYNGATLLGSAGQPPYSLTWTDAVPGACTLSAQATYDNSLIVDSSAVTIEVMGLPAPWLNTDVGSPEAAGASGELNGFYFVSGAGTIGGLSDSFQFVYQPMSGDVMIFAYVSSVQDSSSNDLAGVMIRESLASGAQYAALGLTSDGGVVWSARTNTGSLALSDTWNASSLASSGTSNSGTGAPSDPSTSAMSPAAWLCLLLVDNMFYGYYSTDCASWIAVGTTPSNMGASSYAGLAVGSGLPNLLNTSSFTTVFLAP